MEYFAAIRQAIRRDHKCVALHARTVTIKDILAGAPWEGNVEIYDLVGHARARRCYAWGVLEERESETWDITTVLELPPVSSPADAVTMALAEENAKISDAQAKNVPPRLKLSFPGLLWPALPSRLTVPVHRRI